MKTRMMILGLLALSLSVPAHAYTERRELRLDAAGLEVLKITCGAGELQVEGSASEEIRVTADIEIKGIKDEKAAAFAREKIELWLREKGARAHLKSEIHKGLRRSHAVVDLTVSVPARFGLDIGDGSGSIEIHSMQGDIRIGDGSGEIDVRDSSGNLVVRDGSGGIDIRNLQGNAVIKDGSGSIEASEIAGNITIDDGSGSITVRQIQGSVVINDGSGSIDIRDVEGDVLVESDTSGSRRVSNVRGSFSVQE